MSQMPPESNNPDPQQASSGSGPNTGAGGDPSSASWGPPPPGTNSPIPKEIRTWAMLTHFSALLGLLVQLPAAGLIAPLVLWLLKREEHPFLNDQGKEAVNFHITMALLQVLGVATWCVGGFVLNILAFFVGLIFSIVAGVKANDGVTYRYPLTLRLIN